MNKYKNNFIFFILLLPTLVIAQSKGFVSVNFGYWGKLDLVRSIDRKGNNSNSGFQLEYGRMYQLKNKWKNAVLIPSVFYQQFRFERTAPDLVLFQNTEKNYAYTAMGFGCFGLRISLQHKITNRLSGSIGLGAAYCRAGSIMFGSSSEFWGTNSFYNNFSDSSVLNYPKTWYHGLVACNFSAGIRFKMSNRTSLSLDFQGVFRNFALGNYRGFFSAFNNKTKQEEFTSFQYTFIARHPTLFNIGFTYTFQKRKKKSETVNK